MPARPLRCRLKVLLCAAALAAAVFVSFSGRRDENAARPLVIRERSGLGMNTVMTLSVEAPRETGEEVLEASFSLLNALNDALSRYKKGSDISNVSAASGVSAVPVGEDAAAVLSAALEIAEKTGGFFDPTVGPLTDLWRIIAKGGDWRFPSEEQVAAARALVDYREFSVTPGTPSEARLNLKGAALDLGGIAKGYAADRVAALCKARGVRSALIDLGGNLLVLGRRAGGAPWRLGIRHPLKGGEALVCALEFDPAPGDTMSLVTSGSYERFREAGGRRLSHVFDPRTGLPLETSLLSVSVADPCSARADALATAFLAMGEERARAVLSASFPSTEAVFIHLAPNGRGPNGRGPNGHGPSSRGLSSRGLSEKITVSLTRGLQSRLRLADAETAFEIK